MFGRRKLRENAYELCNQTEERSKQEEEKNTLFTFLFTWIFYYHFLTAERERE